MIEDIEVPLPTGLVSREAAFWSRYYLGGIARGLDSSGASEDANKALDAHRRLVRLESQ